MIQNIEKITEFLKKQKFWPNISPDLKPTEHLWNVIKRKSRMTTSIQKDIIGRLYTVRVEKILLTSSANLVRSMLPKDEKQE